MFNQSRFHKIAVAAIVIMMAILLLVYPLETNARRPLVRIHHSDNASSSSGSVRESYEQSRHDRARRDAQRNVERARDSYESARGNTLRIQSEGPNSQSPNSRYRDLMDAQGDEYRAQSDLREQQNRDYWEQRR
ncbi:MAG: hypothetical protein AB7I18_03045 [Candidatus Berkiella sp.]